MQFFGPPCIHNYAMFAVVACRRMRTGCVCRPNCNLLQYLKLYRLKAIMWPVPSNFVRPIAYYLSVFPLFFFLLNPSLMRATAYEYTGGLL